MTTRKKQVNYYLLAAVSAVCFLSCLAAACAGAHPAPSASTILAAHVPPPYFVSYPDLPQNSRRIEGRNRQGLGGKLHVVQRRQANDIFLLFPYVLVGAAYPTEAALLAFRVSGSTPGRPPAPEVLGHLTFVKNQRSGVRKHKFSVTDAFLAVNETVEIKPGNVIILSTVSAPPLWNSEGHLTAEAEKTIFGLLIVGDPSVFIELTSRQEEVEARRTAPCSSRTGHSFPFDWCWVACTHWGTLSRCPEKHCFCG